VQAIILTISKHTLEYHRVHMTFWSVISYGCEYFQGWP